MRVTLVGSGLIDVPPRGYGAVERRIWNLARGLEALGHPTRIVSRVFSPTRVGAYRFAWWARREVAREPYDVLELETASVANVFGTIGPRGFVYVTPSSHWAGTRGIVERLELAVERRACRLARTVVAVSEVQRCAMRSFERVELVPNGVDCARFKADPARRRGGTILGVGDVTSRKRWHVAAAAIAGLPARLRIVGAWRDEGYARRVLDAAPGQVDVVGRLDEAALADEYAGADVLVHPADREGYPLAVLEAMASGLPIVGTSLLAEGVRQA